MTRRRLTGLLWALKWFAIVAALTFVVDMLYVFWPYPDGPRGVEPLKATVAREAALIDALSDARSASVVTAIVTATVTLEEALRALLPTSDKRRSARNRD